MRDILIEQVRNSSNKIKESYDSYHLFGRIDVFVKDQFVQEMNLNSVLRSVEDIIPEHLTNYVEQILIGDFPELQERQINALYKDGAIYATNLQSSEEDLIDDLIHEFAHACEEQLGFYIYGDGHIVREYTSKMHILGDYLKHDGFNVPKGILDSEFSEEVDNFLYKEVGYDKLYNYSNGLLVNPYSATSVREYFATAFEEFFIGDKRTIKQLSPMVYNKLVKISDEDEVYGY